MICIRLFFADLIVHSLLYGIGQISHNVTQYFEKQFNYVFPFHIFQDKDKPQGNVDLDEYELSTYEDV